MSQYHRFHSRNEFVYLKWYTDFDYSPAVLYNSEEIELNNQQIFDASCSLMIAFLVALSKKKNHGC